MKNYLVHMRTSRGGVKFQTYLVIIAADDIEARSTAERLAEMLPGTVAIVDIKGV